MFRAKEKQKTIEKEQALMRDTLREQINSKMLHSQTNLEKIMLAHTTNSRSKSHFR